MLKIAVVTLFVASTSFAADAADGGTASPNPSRAPELCERFGRAFKKAGKAVGQPPEPETVAFLKKTCLKKSEAQITKDASCLEKVKTEEDLGKCMGMNK